MKKSIITTVSIMILMMVTVAVAEDVPMMINYQGYVETQSGDPVNGNGYFKFAIVDNATSPTTTYWSNDNTTTQAGVTEPATFVSVTVTNGVFSLKLGDPIYTDTIMKPLTETVFQNQNIFVRVWFTDDANASFELLAPDTQVVSSAFAMKAQSANKLEGSGASAFATVGHEHDGTDITGTVDPSAHGHAGSEITGTVDPSAHGHAGSEITGTVDPNAHGHAGSDITSKVPDADKLDGMNSTDFATSGHDHFRLESYYVQAISTTPVTVASTSVHAFCALTFVNFKTDDLNRNKWCRAVRNEDGTWTITARGSANSDVTCEMTCF